jgi:hypothetical protein
MTIIFVISVGVTLVFYYTNTNLLVTEQKYQLINLIHKYPTLIDLTHAINTGELEYDKLPIKAKNALKNFTSNDKMIINFTNGTGK